MIAVAALWRHPIKSHGREALERVTLRAGEALPWDRHWAVTHDATKHAEGETWSNCRNFMIGTRTPALAGLWARLDEATGTVHLRHNRLGTHSFRPEDPDEAAGFIAWVAPLAEGSSVGPQAVVRAGSRGMTDTSFPSVSIMSRASHAAVAARLGGALEEERWRGNIWLDGAAPWEEFEWVGQRLRIGAAELDVVSPVERCLHTAANPRTGERDADTLGVLNGTFGHQNFGIYAAVVKGGDVAIGDTVEVL